MQVQNWGHWLTRAFAAVALIAGALAKQDTFPTLTPWFSAIAALSVVAAVPTIGSKQ